MNSIRNGQSEVDWLVSVWQHTALSSQVCNHHHIYQAGSQQAKKEWSMNGQYWCAGQLATGSVTD